MEIRKKKRKGYSWKIKKKGTVLEVIEKNCLRRAERTAPDAGVAVRRATAIPRDGTGAAEGICDRALKRLEASREL